MLYYHQTILFKNILLEICVYLATIERIHHSEVKAWIVRDRQSVVPKLINRDFCC